MALDPEIQVQQQAFEAEIAVYRARMRDNSALAAVMSNNISKVNQKLAELNKSAALADEFQKLNSAVKKNNYNVMDTAGKLLQLDAAAAESGAALTSQTLANRQAIVESLRSTAKTKTLTDSFQNVVSVVGGVVIGTLTAFATELTRGQGAAGYFNLGAKLMSNNFSVLGKAVASAGDTLSNVGTIMAIASKSVYGKIGGVVVDFIGSILKNVGEQVEKKTQFAIDILNEQVQAMMVAFQTTSKVGAVFGNGLADLNVIADESGLSIKTLAAFIGNTAEQMVLFGGTVAGGAALMGKVNKRFTELDSNGRSFRQQLGNLGISVQDQMSITADYLEMLARGGRLREKTDSEIARETFEYAKSLKVISTITGEDAKAAQKRAKSALEQSYVQAKMGRLGEDASKKFTLGVAGMPAELQRAVQQMATEGFIADQELAAAVAQVPALQEMLTRIAAGITDQSKSVTDFTSDLTALRASLGPIAKEQVLTASDGIGRANLLLQKFGGIETVFQAVLNMGTAAQANGEAQKNAQTVIEKAAVVTDKLTQVIGNAEAQFEKFARSLETNLQDPMKKYATFIDAQIKQSGEIIQGILRQLFGPNAIPARTSEGAGGTYTETAGGGVTGAQNNIIPQYVEPGSGEWQRRMNLGLPIIQESPQDRRLKEGTQTSPGMTQTTPQPVSSVADPVAVATMQTNKNLEELIEQNKELIRLSTQTARALA